MIGFEDGLRFLADEYSGLGADAAAVLRAESYTGEVEKTIRELVDQLNKFNGKNTGIDKLKGNVAEHYHAGTFNINAAVKGSSHRMSVPESNDFASVDIESNFDSTKYGSKYYKTPLDTAKAQSVSLNQEYRKYQSKGGTDSFNKFAADRGFENAESDPHQAIYTGQIRLVPADQLEDVAAQLRRLIEKESVNRPEQVARYQDTLDHLTDRLRDNKGVESVPLSREEAEEIARLAKEGKINAKDLELTLDKLIAFEDVLREGLKAGATAAMLTMVLKAAPEIYKGIAHLCKTGEIDAEQFKKAGFAALSGGAQAFISGTISASLTITCKQGLLGTAFQSLNPHIIGAATALTMNVIQSSFEVAAGRKSREEFVSDFARDMFIAVGSTAGGILVQSYLPIPAAGYMLGSALGSAIGAFAYNTTQTAVISFCVESGFTMFGLVEQDYTLPNKILDQIGIDTFDFETMEADSFELDTFEPETFEYESFLPESLGITMLRRGVIGVSRVGYLMG